MGYKTYLIGRFVLQVSNYAFLGHRLILLVVGLVVGMNDSAYLPATRAEPTLPNTAKIVVYLGLRP